jgi:hypothetical protein
VPHPQTLGQGQGREEQREPQRRGCGPALAERGGGSQGQQGGPGQAGVQLRQLFVGLDAGLGS